MAKKRNPNEDAWMYEKPKCPYKKPSKKTKARFDHRPLPKLPLNWPTDKMSKVILRTDGIRQLSHPQRDIHVLCEKEWRWVLPSELGKVTRSNAP